MGWKIIAFLAIAATVHGAVIEKTKVPSRSAIPVNGEIQETVNGAESTTLSSDEQENTLTSVDAGAIDVNEESGDKRTRKTRATDYYDEIAEFPGSSAMRSRTVERLRNPSRQVRAAGDFQMLQEHQNPMYTRQNFDDMNLASTEGKNRRQNDGGLDQGPSVLPQEEDEPKIERLTKLSRSPRQIYNYRYGYPNQGTSPKVCFSTTTPPPCPTFPTCPSLPPCPTPPPCPTSSPCPYQPPQSPPACPTYQSTTTAPSCCNPGSSNDPSDPSQILYLSFPQSTNNSPQSCPVSNPPACPICCPPPTTTAPSCCDPGSSNDPSDPSQTLYLSFPQSTNYAPQSCPVSNPPACPICCPSPTTTTPPPCPTSPPCCAPPSPIPIIFANPCSCPSQPNRNSCICSTTTAAPPTCSNTAGVMTGSGNGNGGNSFSSSINCVTGTDPSSYQNICMLSDSGNGSGGNNLTSCVNYVCGGNLLCNCGQGDGGNRIQSCYNIVTGPGCSLVDGTCGTTILQSLLNLVVGQNCSLFGCNCPCNANGQSCQQDPCSQPPSDPCCQPPADPCAPQSVYACSPLPQDPCNPQQTVYSCSPVSCQSPPTCNYPPCIILPGSSLYNKKK